jgi:pimeloyl-ACP methyl ester carboxylesterase
MLDPPGVSLNDLGRIEAPTLVLAGQHDLIRRAHTRALAAAIPNARLRIVREGSHAVLRDEANEVTPEILRFLSATLT